MPVNDTDGDDADDPVRPPDALALGRRVRRGDARPETLLAAAEARADRLNDEIGAICRRTPAQARTAITDLRPRLTTREETALSLPFAGVPFLMKDLGAPMKGVPTVAGSRWGLRHAPPAPDDGDLCRAFAAAGLIPFGKTTVPEFGLSLATDPAIGPRCRNPWDPTRIPGGSSGGAAAAVAAGIVAIAHATDAGGSIRVPAACCGVVGMKPSRGSTPGGPDFDNLMFGLAAELVVATTVRDVAAAHGHAEAFVTGPFAAPRAPRAAGGEAASGDAAGRLPAIGAFPPDDPDLGDGERRSAYRRAIDHLETAGHPVCEVRSAALSEARSLSAAVFRDVACITTAAGVAALAPPPEAGDLEPLTRAAARRGAALGAVGAAAAFRAIGRVSRMLQALFGGLDVLVTPMLSGPPPALGAFATDQDDVDAHFAALDAFAPWAAMANVGGQPALSLPVGLDRDSLPMAVQLVGPLGGDAALLKVAFALERANPWPRFAPIAGFDA